MSAEGVFVDTNIIVYAFDLSDREKNGKAREVVDSLWLERERAWLSIQVLQELFVNLSKMMLPEDAESAIRSFSNWNLVVNDRGLLLDALEARRMYQVSFWDALILAAAVRAGARTLLSEDFTHQRVYGAVRVINPFL